MFIKHDEYELLEFFESEPIFIGDKDAGDLIYSIQNSDDIKLILNICTYEAKSKIAMTYKDNLIFSIELDNVISITKSLEGLKLVSLNRPDIIMVAQPDILVKIPER
jgi:hypothetical protein